MSNLSNTEQVYPVAEEMLVIAETLAAERLRLETIASGKDESEMFYIDDIDDQYYETEYQNLFDNYLQSQLEKLEEIQKKILLEHFSRENPDYFSKELILIAELLAAEFLNSENSISSVSFIDDFGNLHYKGKYQKLFDDNLKLQMERVENIHTRIIKEHPNNQDLSNYLI